jgi:3-oxoacyl-[acyl-carrier protein] reductase
MDLNGKVVLVTGSSSGIGQAIAVAFAQQKARVIVHYRNNKEGAEHTKKQITELGCEALIQQADLTRTDDVAKLFDNVKKEYGALDILVNNAGAAHPKPFADTDKTYWQMEFEHNFLSMVLCCKKAIMLMESQNSGKIINMTSVNGVDYMGRPGVIAYSAAKAALINFTKTLAQQYAPRILINAIAPGKTRTTYYDQFDDAYLEKTTDTIPIKRFVTVDEVAEAFIFVARNDALVGEVLVIDGGFSLKNIP